MFDFCAINDKSLQRQRKRKEREFLDLGEDRDERSNESSDSSCDYSDESDAEFEKEFKRREKLRNLVTEYGNLHAKEQEMAEDEKDHESCLDSYRQINTALNQLISESRDSGVDPIRELKATVLDKIIGCGRNMVDFGVCFEGSSELIKLGKEAEGWKQLKELCCSFGKWEMALVALNKCLSLNPYFDTDFSILASFFDIHYNLKDFAKCIQVAHEASSCLSDFVSWTNPLEGKLADVVSSEFSSLNKVPSFLRPFFSTSLAENPDLIFEKGISLDSEVLVIEDSWSSLASSLMEQYDNLM